jgi:hypothetical protein
MARKTFEVEKIRDKANYFLLHSPSEKRAEREVIAGFVEGILFETGNYNGFRYLLTGNHDGGYFIFDEKDDTRRYYY